MAVEETTTTPETNFEDNSGSDLIRKIAAAIIGILVIILIVLAAKWLGDRIKEKFFPGTVITTPTKKPTPTPTPTPAITGTYSTIPATGPEDYVYLIVALMILGGVSALALAKRK